MIVRAPGACFGSDQGGLGMDEGLGERAFLTIEIVDWPRIKDEPALYRGDVSGHRGRVS